MSTYTPMRDWTIPLRNLIVNASLASLFVVPSANNITIVNQQPRAKIEIVATIPDGGFDFRTAYVRTPQGLNRIEPSLTTQEMNSTENDSIPYVLRDITGLSVEKLASLANVSRNAYYKWLDGKGVSSEHVARLHDLLNTFRTLHNIRGTNLKEFLETPGLAGKPIDLLSTGESSVVIGLAMQNNAALSITPTLSGTARKISGLSGWLPPVTGLNWNAPRSAENEKEDALARLNSGSKFEEINLSDNIDEDEAFVAWGFFLE
jgi:transcriptional regulator with XRE-family HTH domain